MPALFGGQRAEIRKHLPAEKKTGASAAQWYEQQCAPERQPAQIDLRRTACATREHKRRAAAQQLSLSPSCRPLSTSPPHHIYTARLGI